MSNLHRGPSIDAPTKFRFIWPNGFRGEESKKSTNRNKNHLWRPCLFTDRDGLSKRHRGPSIDASYNFRFIRQSIFREDFFRNQPIRNKNHLWRPCLFTDRDGLSKLHRGPSIDASYNFRFIRQSIFREDFFRNQPIRNKNRLWQPCLLTDWDEMSN